MTQDLLLAVVLPLALLLLLSLALERWGDRLPGWLEGLAGRSSWIWNIGIGLIIVLSLLRWLLQR